MSPVQLIIIQPVKVITINAYAYNNLL